MVLVVSCMQWAHGCHLYILSFISLTYHCDASQERPYPNHWAIVGTGLNAMRSKQETKDKNRKYGGLMSRDLWLVEFKIFEHLNLDLNFLFEG